MSIDQLTPERRAIAEQAAAVIKACIGGAALSEALQSRTTETQSDLVVTTDSTE